MAYRSIGHATGTAERRIASAVGTAGRRSSATSSSHRLNSRLGHRPRPCLKRRRSREQCPANRLLHLDPGEANDRTSTFRLQALDSSAAVLSAMSRSAASIIHRAPRYSFDSTKSSLVNSASPPRLSPHAPWFHQGQTNGSRCSSGILGCARLAKGDGNIADMRVGGGE